MIIIGIFTIIFTYCHWYVVDGFLDPDSYMRIARTYDWWTNCDMSRFHDIHWSYVLDAILIFIAYPVKWIYSCELKEALVKSAIFFNPFCSYITSLLMYYIANPKQRIFALNLAAFQPFLYIYSSCLKPDHHSLLILINALSIVCNKKGHTILAGFWAAIGTWVSFEAMIFLCIYYMFTKIEMKFLISWLIGLIVVIVCTQRHYCYFDTLSWLHVMYMILFIIWKKNKFYGILIFLLSSIIYPDLILKYINLIDPMLNKVWHMHIKEMRPSYNDMYLFTLCFGPFFILPILFKTHHKLSFAFLITAALSLFEIRHAIWAQFFGIPHISQAFMRIWESKKTFYKILSVVIVFYMPYFNHLGYRAKPLVSIKERIEAIEELPKSDLHILTLPDVESTMILLHTKNHLISLPYHRNTERIIDTYKIFSSEDESEIKTLIAKYKLNTIFINWNTMFSIVPRSPFARNIQSNHYKWITPIPLKSKNFGLYKISS